MGWMNWKKREKAYIYSPATGRSAELSEIPDLLFAQKVMGDGIAIFPSSGKIYAPCDAKVSVISYANHIFGLQMFLGCELMRFA